MHTTDAKFEVKENTTIILCTFFVAKQIIRPVDIRMCVKQLIIMLAFPLMDCILVLFVS